MTQTPHNISQYCRQELCVVFFRFQLSRAKGTTGGYILLYKCILYVVYAGPLINLMMLGGQGVQGGAGADDGEGGEPAHPLPEADPGQGLKVTVSQYSSTALK